MGRARLGDYLLGVQGVALLRTWLTGERHAAEQRLGEITGLVKRFDEGVPAVTIDVPELEVSAGYAAWAPSYDDMPNPLIRLEEPVVRALVAEAPPGRALDAACGTGRHAAHLRARGYDVVGVDSTPEMLARARANVTGVDFRIGDLTALPVESASVDLVVCALALTHLPALGPAIAELARVVRPGGRIIVSDFHPAMALFGGQALFQAGDGSWAIVRGRLHYHGDYIAAFLAAGLEVRRCLEPRWSDADVPLIAGPLMPLAPEAFRAALVGVPGALVWELATGEVTSGRP